MTPLLITLMRTKWGCHTGPSTRCQLVGGTAMCQEGNAGEGRPAAACVSLAGLSQSGTVSPSITFPLAAETPVPSCGRVTPERQASLGGMHEGQRQCPSGSHPLPSFLFAPESTVEDYWAVNKGINGADGNISW